MLQTPDPASDRRTERDEHWKSRVVPTAQGLEGFAWRVAWFAVLVKILFFS
jgi:hypothetical protein